jgi:hypothetical protein
MSHGRPHVRMKLEKKVFLNTTFARFLMILKYGPNAVEGEWTLVTDVTCLVVAIIITLSSNLVKPI